MLSARKLPKFVASEALKDVQGYGLRRAHRPDTFLEPVQPRFPLPEQFATVQGRNHLCINFQQG